MPITVNDEGEIESEVEVADGIDFDHDGTDDLLYAAGGVVGSSVFISIHFNAAESSGSSGVETYILPPAGYAGTAKSPWGTTSAVSIR